MVYEVNVENLLFNYFYYHPEESSILISELNSLKEVVERNCDNFKVHISEDSLHAVLLRYPDYLGFDNNDSEFLDDGYIYRHTSPKPLEPVNMVIPRDRIEKYVNTIYNYQSIDSIFEHGILD